MTTTTQTQSSPVSEQELSNAQQPPAPVPTDKTPQEFYAEMTKRPDVRTILEELARG